MFVLLPLAGVLTARTAGLRRADLVASTIAASAASTAFLISYAPHILAGADSPAWLGLAERAAFLAQLVLLIVLAAPAAITASLPRRSP